MTEDNLPGSADAQNVTRLPDAPNRFRIWRRPVATAEDVKDWQYRKWAELWATIILSIATLVSAWAGYEASKWNSVNTVLNLQATTYRIESGRLTAEAQETLLVDVQLFTNWTNAVGNGNRELANFYRQRLRDNFLPAFEAWLATDPLQNQDAPGSPFEMPQYRLIEQDEAAALIEQAGQLNQSAELAGSFADQYTLTVVILAGSLLLAGLAHRFEWAELRLVVVFIALLVLLISVLNIIRLPIA